MEYGRIAVKVFSKLYRSFCGVKETQKWEKLLKGEEKTICAKGCVNEGERKQESTPQ